MHLLRKHRSEHEGPLSRIFTLKNRGTDSAVLGFRFEQKTGGEEHSLLFQTPWIGQSFDQHSGRPRYCTGTQHLLVFVERLNTCLQGPNGIIKGQFPSVTCTFGI